MTDDARLPTVCVLVPCYNEREWIRGCLESLLQNDYPSESLEVVVVDGGSDDGTLEVVTELQHRYLNLKLLSNPDRQKSRGLNLAIRNTDSDVVLRADAHALYSQDYIRRLAEGLDRFVADNMGGIRDTYVGGSLMAQAIGVTISHRFGAGNAYYRTGSDRVRTVETVFGGCYRRDVFATIGYFNERLIRTQDREFNRRLLAAGGKIVLDPEARCTYYPRSNFLDYWRWNWDGAYWLFYARRFTDVAMISPRNLAPMALVLVHVIGPFGAITKSWPWSMLPVAAYWMTSVVVSVATSLRRGNLPLFPYLVLTFAATHFGYGIASMWGLVSAMTRRKT